MIWKSYKVGLRTVWTAFNPTKTKVLFISNSENGSDINLRFNNSRLELSTVHMDLGVTLSNDTKWANPIDGIYKSSSNKVAVLKKLKYVLNTETILHIYRCFILPIIEYASEVWDGCSKAVENLLESIQLDVARLPCGLPIFCN